MKKGLAVLTILVFSAVILSCYSGIMNKTLVDVSRYPLHVTTETSIILPTSHASHDTDQTGETDSHTTASIWQITEATLKTMATQSMGASTKSAAPTTLTDGTTKVPQDSTQTTTTVNTDTPGAPGSSTPTPSTEWSSTSMAHTTMAAQSTAGHTTLGMASVTTPPNNQTSLTTPGTATPDKGKTTQAINTTTHHVTATTSSITTTAGPTLVPRPSSPQTGSYLVYNGSRACMKADMGVQLFIQDKMYPSSQMYFNLNPNMTRASGSCGPQRTNLLLTFPGGFVNLTFVKVKQSYHIETVEASLTVTALAKIYRGLKGGLTMFETKVGHSFKCTSEQTLELSSSLQLHTVDVQLQAFDFDGEHFGNVIECTSDYTIMIPVIIVIIISVCLLALAFCGIRLRRKSLGYQRI
ncbi:lysosome-associated membrane glycoprotein 3 isoform X2 [Trichosurus vulpecula]|uniref:lysosome-associated membrane glycoprotein 3 isoform X2 n=1 Tax=Trichosurus vulpecula TaxID=9337 RepID=UPI00186B24FD|nr:lysosome-associated membrane glycoprotein 3 isoform X2 [Trichosurus vulpecula]